ncbi:Protein At-4/1 [Vitis vinifera]|uniref:Protein At-4/1 n=1 Tax=Vitis vinifera TaxID=29760 RepID=A0A438JFN6_VITVI|nr:Protein At-4/1 [Vitis vinifera]
MAATSDEEMESLLSTFDQIYKDFQNGVVEVQLLRSNCNVEIEKRQALQSTCDSLKQG